MREKLKGIIVLVLLLMSIQLNSQSVTVKVSYYNPTKSQCSSTPLLTADGSKINIHHIMDGRIRWIAVSRDLRSKFPYGSLVKIESSGDKRIDGIWEVHDTMNKRHTMRIDILTHDKNFMIKPLQVKMTKIK